MYKNVFRDWIEERRILESHLQKYWEQFVTFSLMNVSQQLTLNKKAKFAEIERF